MPPFDWIKWSSYKVLLPDPELSAAECIPIPRCALVNLSWSQRRGYAIHYPCGRTRKGRWSIPSRTYTKLLALELAKGLAFYLFYFIFVEPCTPAVSSSRWRNSTLKATCRASRSLLATMFPSLWLLWQVRNQQTTLNMCFLCNDSCCSTKRSG